jgi:hypothetical protein
MGRKTWSNGKIKSNVLNNKQNKFINYFKYLAKMTYVAAVAGVILSGGSNLDLYDAYKFYLISIYL